MDKDDRRFRLVKMQNRSVARYHGEIARTSTWLLSGLIVAMTFLLLAGLRNPHKPLLIFLYVALGSFALVALLYPLINLLSDRLFASEVGKEAPKRGDKKALEAAEKALKSQRSTLLVIKIIQQAFFVVGLIAAVGFAVEVSLYFFVTSAAPTPSAAS